MKKIVGIVGLGIMGGTFTRHLVEAGWRVIGYDTDAARREEARALGAEVAHDAAAVAAEAETILTVLPSAAALQSVAQAIADAGAQRRTVVEMSTLALEDKLQAQRTLTAAGHTMLDCPISGTGAQARTKDLILFVSGDRAAGDALQPLFAAFSAEAHHVGAFGNGIRMKFVANHLVAIHVAAAGEALALGIKAGLDPQQMLQLVTAGAADSRMLRLRGPMMVANSYGGPNISARTTILAKDASLIGRFADTLDCPVPMLSAAKALFVAAVATGHADEDPASVCAVSEQMAGSPRLNVRSVT
jgi:3-hydroxyisobutyrate dehydrogenase-like beta-hydroxyacid dehydrogenase